MSGWLKLPWLVGVVVAWSLVVSGAGDNFFVENTSSAMDTAAAGQTRAAVGALLLAGLGGAVLLLRSRFRRTAAGLVGGSALVVLVTSGSEVVLVTGLLSTVPVGVGALLALVPPRPAQPGGTVKP